MFQQKKTAEPESDSDWDSLPGDIQEPTSSPEATPRHQPAPPPGSPKVQVPHKRPQVKTQVAVTAAERKSATNSPVSPARGKPGTPSSQMPSQMYGKPGITTFVDRSSGINTTSFSDQGLESRQNKELKPDVNENKIKQSSQRRGDDGIKIEMNEVAHHQRNPPFTDFQAALASQDSLNLINMQTEKPKKEKVKPSYVTQKEAHNEGHSWDSESDGEQEAITHSRQHLTPREKNSKTLKKDVEPNNLANEVIPNSHDLQEDGLKTCCVPLNPRTHVTGFSYYFDHGHNHHLDVSPEWKEAYMKRIADRSEKWLQYFWQEFFSALRIITDFAFIFVLELLRFVLHYVALRVLGGILITFGDHFLKPYLAVLFNSIIQPIFIFTRNVLAGAKNLLQPLMDITNSFIAQLAALLRAFRLFELNWKPVYERGQKHDVHVL